MKIAQYALLGLLALTPAAHAEGVFQLEANWTELKRGWNDFKMLVKDQDGKKVADAKIVLDYDMPSMDMDPPVGPIKETAAGQYQTRVMLGMRGTWKFVIDVTKGDAVDHFEKEIEIKH